MGKHDRYVYFEEQLISLTRENAQLAFDVIFFAIW